MKSKVIIILLILLALVGGNFILNQKSEDGIAFSQAELKQLKNQQVIFETNKGKFVIELYPEKSPITVANFINYVKRGFYDKTIFHRTLPGVILQGGGFSEGMNLKPTNDAIENESHNLLPNIKGAVSMARKDFADSATSQFFINLRINPSLDYRANQPGYTVFANVVEGLELLEVLAKSKTRKYGAHQNVPLEEIVIQSVKLTNRSTLLEIGQVESKNVHISEFQEGVHYVRLKSPLPLLKTEKIEVISAFSYGCGHCYGLYGATQDWKLENKKQVEFSFFHAVWSKAMRVYARTYYTAIELGVDRNIHVPLYEAIVIHQQKLSNSDEIATFFESYGIDRSKFIEIYDSEHVVKRVEQAEKLTEAFNLASVPEFIVAGKYRVDPMRAGGQQEIFKVIDFLVEREKKDLSD